MNVIVKGCLIVVIIILHYESRITLALENETDTSKEEIPSSSEILFAHLLPKTSHMYETSSLKISSGDFNLNVMETPHLPKTELKLITSSHNLFNSISQSVKDDTFIHLIKDSIAIEDSLITIESTLPETNSYLLSTFSSQQSYDKENDAITMISAEVSPTAERRIYIPSSQISSSLTPSTISSVVGNHSGIEASFSNFDFIEVSSIIPTSVESAIEASISLPLDEIDSLTYNSKFFTLNNFSNFSNVFIKNNDSSTAGSSKLTSLVASTVIKNGHEFESKSVIFLEDINTDSHNDSFDEYEREIFKQGNIENRMDDYLNDSYDKSEGEIFKNGNISHEIISDSHEMKNKTSRNEEPRLDDIISSIVHLLAGNVQLARPVPNVFASPPKRLNRPQSPFHSTRINNRGPLSSTTPYSRTVVVFSQPQNPINAATEIHRPVQFVPSGTIGGILSRPLDKTMHVIRIQPTKVSERPSSSISVIRFYHPGSKIPDDKQNQPPFNGEIFTHQGIILKPKQQYSNVPGGAILASLADDLKPYTSKENSITNHTHYIFSDSSGSVGGFHTTAITSKTHTAEILTTLSPLSSTTDKISSTNTFEVLSDPKSSQKSDRTSLLSSSSSVIVSKETIPRESIKPTRVQNHVPTTENQTVPFGPITDWVPLFEPPSMKFKPISSNLNKTRTDNDVSIIMQPIVFDVTVSNSFNDPVIYYNKTAETFTSSVFNVSETEKFEPENSTSSFASETKLKSSTLEDGNSQNKYLSSTHSTPFLEESKLITTPIIETKTSEIELNRGDLPTVVREENTSVQQSSTLTKNISRSSSVQYVFSKNQVEEKMFPMTPTLRPVSSKTFETSSSTPSHDVPNLGRPFVIPVDIEEVRPYVGAINPVDQDRTRAPYPPYRGGSGSVQVTRAGVNIRDDSTSSPNHPLFTSRTPIIRSHPRPRPNTIRIDTCIVGDDSTCESKSNETCKTEQGISSCHCRPGYARSYTRGPCTPVVSLLISLKVDRLGNRKISFSPKYLDKNSEEYRIMEFEAKQALNTLFTHTAFSRTFLGTNVNTFYSIGGKIIINATVYLEEKESTRAQSVRLRLRQEIAESIKNRNRNIGESRLYAEGPLSPLTNIDDVNECSDANLNDCAGDGTCLNIFGTFLCKCKPGYVDPFKHDERRSGRKCLACQPDYCTYHGQCFVERDQKLCKCHGNYIGRRCEIDGEVLGVALGASLAATIIIVLTLSCLCIWNRKWKKQQQKAEVLSSRSYNSNNTFSCISNMLNANVNPYNLTMEDRMRWAHISEVVKSAAVPNSEHPYASTSLEQAPYSSRFQQPTDDEASWYDYRTRPRSRVLSHPRTSPNTSYYEMETSARRPYMTTSGHSSNRVPKKLTRY
ncbi:SEA domain-containing protein [Nephila pilipes]|uniref:SEA domain-containing protein n=1 Tax=Nephila pilipes TaxID=299642 RepID=A0A8X6ULB8_NEPPI|nr:SEA domain-containing protein [Nephila pilipes]